MNSLTLSPAAQKQLFQINTEKSHPKLSLRRVLWVRFLRWIDKASPEAMRKALRRGIMCLAICFGVFTPNLSLRTATYLLQWNGYKIPMCFALVLLTLNVKRIYRWLRKKRPRKGNQHTFHGVPVGELASFLKSNGSFKRDEAISRLALSQGQWTKIAEDLEKHDVLVRGENNARVLREISLEDLVRQLRDKFPLVWSDERQVWAERNGTFDTWCLSQDFQRRKLKEETERKERKLKRLEKKIQEKTTFAGVMDLCG